MDIKNFDITSAKYFILTLIVCLLFILLVANAFQYLPDNKDLNKPINEVESFQDNNDDISSYEEDDNYIQDDDNESYNDSSEDEAINEYEDFSGENIDESETGKGEFLKIWD